jgi:energy-coupling factor transporter ATP-binding protein EcfA2
MQISDLLIAANLANPDEIEKAIQLQQQQGGTLVDQLHALVPDRSPWLRNFISRIPPESRTVEETGIHSTELLNLLTKQIYMTRLETSAQFVAALKLAPKVVDELIQLATNRNLLIALGGGVGLGSMRYELSEAGKRWAQDALKVSQYVGPAPVTLEDFCRRVRMQRVNEHLVTFEGIKRALEGYTVTDQFIQKIGPALNSGKPLLIYGPSGNGKTTVTLSFANVFNAVIYLPYAVLIEGQIMRVFDPSLHTPLQAPTNTSGRGPAISSLRREESDSRWVPMLRPFIFTGGELTLEMLDLSYDATAGFYEAPLHVKALGGCFVIDDFGRQLVSPTVLLNRWIVPMGSRIDYLKLHTGTSFAVPFEALLIFSTNLNPAELMDAAFLRRLPYKIEIAAPSRHTYRTIFESVCRKANIEFDEQIFEMILEKVTVEKKLDLAAFHARFIIDQVVAISRFLGRPPRLDNFAIDYALDNLAVRPTSEPGRMG